MLIKVHMRSASVKVCQYFCWISSFIADAWNSCWHGMYAEW